jgi:hypothetical protein
MAAAYCILERRDLAIYCNSWYTLKKIMNYDPENRRKIGVLQCTKTAESGPISDCIRLLPFSEF